MLQAHNDLRNFELCDILPHPKIVGFLIHRVATRRPPLESKVLQAHNDLRNFEFRNEQDTVSRIIQTQYALSMKRGI